MSRVAHYISWICYPAHWVFMFRIFQPSRTNICLLKFVSWKWVWNNWAVNSKLDHRCPLKMQNCAMIYFTMKFHPSGYCLSNENVCQYIQFKLYLHIFHFCLVINHEYIIAEFRWRIQSWYDNILFDNLYFWSKTRGFCALVCLDMSLPFNFIFMNEHSQIKKGMAPGGKGGC